MNPELENSSGDLPSETQMTCFFLLTCKRWETRTSDTAPLESRPDANCFTLQSILDLSPAFVLTTFVGPSRMLPRTCWRFSHLAGWSFSGRYPSGLLHQLVHSLESEAHLVDSPGQLSHRWLLRGAASQSGSESICKTCDTKDITDLYVA